YQPAARLHLHARPRIELELGPPQAPAWLRRFPLREARPTHGAIDCGISALIGPLPEPSVAGLMGFMIRRLLPSGLMFTIVLACRAAAQETTAPPLTAKEVPIGSDGITFFESKVRPILAEHCYRCHGPDSGAGKAELRVDSLDSLLKGGVSGPALIRGEP